MSQLLSVKNLKTSFQTAKGLLPAVDGIDLEINHGETLGLVGESGCGKSVTALSVMRLIPNPPGTINGDIRFDGRDVLAMSEKEIRALRGKDISMIFQEPMSSLNPVFTIGDQISEAIRLHQNFSAKEVRERTMDMLELVGIPLPQRRVRDYPHHLSGGMRQRVMIAMALACNPKLLFADEPTTALDVTIQAQILELIRQLKDTINTSLILITHDLGIIAEMVDRVMVMYAGKIVEEAPVGKIFSAPKHPYTEGLLNSIPRLDGPRSRLQPIKGLVPNPLDLPRGCRFHPRCPYVMDICKEEQPQLKNLEPGRTVSCWLR